MAKCLAEVVWRHGVPAKIIHDRAAEFLSDVLQHMAAILGLKQFVTSWGHPQTDGLVKCFYRNLEDNASKVSREEGLELRQVVGCFVVDV